MRLLDPTQIKDLKAQETVRELIRSEEVQKVADKTRKSLANAEAEFNASLARNRETWIKEEEEHAKRKAELKTEIDTLEAKKANALIPLGILKDGVYDQMDDIVAFLADLRLREEHVEDLAERLEDKLDSVGQKEQDLKTKATKLSLKEEGLERQVNLTILNGKKLSKEMSDFAAFCQKLEADIEKRRTAIFLKEQTLKAKETTQNRTDTALSQLATQLESERETLARAWEELERKKAN